MIDNSDNPTSTEKSILALLEKRKTEGWSVDARAILFSEWMAHSLYVIENDTFPDTIPLSVKTHALVAKGVREFLWDAKESGFMGTDNEKYVFVSEMKNAMKSRVAKANDVQLIKDLLITPYDQSYGSEYLLDILSGSVPSKWKTILDMGMDEDDLEQYIVSKIPQAHNANEEKNLDRATCLDLLKQQMKDCDIPAIFFDPMTFESTSALQGITASLEKTKQAYQSIDAPTVGAGKFFVSFSQPYAKGNSGYMDCTFHESGYLVSLSNQCGWDYSEVLTHEILHAHDALLGKHVRGYGGSDLLSDLNEDNKHPIFQVWVELDHNISSLEKDRDLLSTKKLCREGIGKRWSSMGLSSEDVERVVVAWEQSTTQEKDQDLLTNFEGLFSKTPFKESSEFRSKVILAEYKLLDSMTPNAVFVDFVKQFDGLTSLDKTGSYGRGYFEDLAEKMARSVQMALDGVDQKNTDFTSNSMQEKLSDNNPFEKRWLVYPEQGHASAITKYWQDFYNQDVVREAYKVILKETRVLDEDAESVDVAPLNKQRLVQFKKDHIDTSSLTTKQHVGLKV